MNTTEHEEMELPPLPKLRNFQLETDEQLLDQLMRGLTRRSDQLPVIFPAYELEAVSNLSNPELPTKLRLRVLNTAQSDCKLFEVGIIGVDDQDQLWFDVSTDTTETTWSDCADYVAQFHGRFDGLQEAIDYVEATELRSTEPPSVRRFDVSISQDVALVEDYLGKQELDYNYGLSSPDEKGPYILQPELLRYLNPEGDDASDCYVLLVNMRRNGKLFEQMVHKIYGVDGKGRLWFIRDGDCYCASV